MQREFVAAQPENLRVLVFYYVLEQAADADDQLVAGTVAEVVVDVFEVIDIQEQHRTFFAVCKRGFQHFLQRNPVWQSGERIVSGEAFDL